MTIRLDKHEGVARIVLDRPADGNAINLALARALCDAVRDAAGDARIRCAVLTGAGRMFCVGGDIKAFTADRAHASAAMRELAETLHQSVAALAQMEKPLVALVNGPAAGAGMSLALLGDIVVASKSASFTCAYAGIGLTPDGGMSWLLPRLIGLRKAQDLLVTNRRVASEEAATIGLVTRVVDDAALSTEGEALAARLAAAPTRAIAATRRLVSDGMFQQLDRHLDAEADSLASAAAGSEAAEGISAFLERRPADFSRRGR